MARRKTHSASFKSRVALETFRGDQTIAELAAKYKVHPILVTKLKKQAVDGLVDIFSGKGRKARADSHEAEIKELHAKIGRCAIHRDPFSLASLKSRE